MVFFRLNTVILGWRQADMGSIALNYYEHGFRLLYPQVLWGGNGPGYVEMEFPILPYATALFYRLFGIHDGLAVVLPFLGGVATVLVMYFLTTRLYDTAVGLVAGTFVAVSPLLSHVSQSFMGETPAIFLLSFGVLAFVRWAEDNTWKSFFLAAFSIAGAVLLKLTSLYIGLPILFLFVHKYGAKFFMRTGVWLFGFLVLVPPLLWYYHAHTLYQEYGNTFGILSGGYNKFGRLDLILSPSFYLLIGGRIFFYVLTPVVFLFTLYSLTRRPSQSRQHVFHYWIAAVLIYIIAAAEGHKDMNYYQVPMLLPCAALGAAGFFACVDALESGGWTARFVRKPSYSVSTLVLILVLTAIGANYLFYERSVLGLLPGLERTQRIGRAVQKVAPEGSLIIVTSAYGSGKMPGEIDTPPEIFYHSNRRGWYVALSWLNAELIEDLRSKGARYLIVAAEDIEKFKSSSPAHDYLCKTYRIVIDNDECLVFYLSKDGTGFLASGWQTSGIVRGAIR
jgi:4-amino-4-deoxy-L-arabinose transferase-like glycosyltransferase